MKFKSALTLLALASLAVSCSNPAYDSVDPNQLLTATERFSSSTPSGNLMASAMRRANKLDVVLYPSEFLDDAKIGALTENLNETDVDNIVSMFPNGKKDEFLVGTMKGKDIKSLILQRSKEKYYVPFQTAGIKYHINFIGGIDSFQYFNNHQDNKIDNNKYYKVAISKYFYNNRDVFPNYEYKNGLSFSFKHSDLVISARKSLKDFLLTKEWKNIFLKERRAEVTKNIQGDLGEQAISKIQGISHISPIYGYKVKTTGVVTAAGLVDRFPKAFEVYIQSEKADGDDRTSEGLRLLFDDENTKLSIGDKIEVEGVVYEEISSSGLGATSLREITGLKVLSENNSLPEAVVLGPKGRKIPSKIFSNHIGNLNLKPSLDLNQGVDFFESIEGMRIAIDNPAVVGFRGGNEDAADLGKAKGYLNLYLKADGNKNFENKTANGGIIINEKDHDHNPEIIQLTTSHLTKGVPTDNFYKVGDVISGRIEGVMAYAQNIFGGGEFTLVLPEAQDAFDSIKNNEAKFVPMDQRRTGVTKLVADKDSITVATYNLENLAGNQDDRIKDIAKSIEKNLKCPDVVNLVEIQDNNGITFSGGSGAEVTLKKLIRNMDCGDVQYDFANIDPIEHNEGGQPGGNIRVAQIFNTNKLEFVSRPVTDPLAETYVMSNGSLSHNPGRVFPNDEAFAGTRRSIVTEFSFKGKKFFVIGNHFNSKLGDSSRWGAMQPFNSGSEKRRIKLASKINKFVELLHMRSPGAGVIVLGDFNANIFEGSMKVLEGRYLKNMIYYKDLVAENDRYTTNHNGNSQPLDYIFANKTLLDMSPELEILHFNSDYMGKLSDHDPLIAKFKFQ